MINLAEFVVYSTQIRQIGEEIDNKMAKALEGVPSKNAAIKMALDFSDEYYERMQEILDTALREAAENAIKYHTPWVEDAGDVAEDIVTNVKKTKYYGLTYNARMIINKKRLERNISRSAQILDENGIPKRLAGVYTESVPFGAQVNSDRRMLQATIEQIEHETVQYVARTQDLPLIRWKLAGKHAKPDVCDDLANYVDTKVVAYIQENRLDLDPKGLYFREEFPRVPHPFCQCEFAVSGTAGATGTRLQRAARRIRRIISKIRSR